jgi:hypothetical protein
MNEHWFWWLLVVAVLVWYSTVTIYIAIRGTLDIRHMLRRLAERPVETRENRGWDEPSPAP